MVETETSQLDNIFHALSDPTRRSILRTLSLGESTVGEIAKPYEFSLNAVSKHLKVLETAELISREKRGSFQVVRIRVEPMKTVHQWLAQYEQFWNKRLDAMTELLEGEGDDD